MPCCDEKWISHPVLYFLHYKTIVNGVVHFLAPTSPRTEVSKAAAHERCEQLNKFDPNRFRGVPCEQQG